MSLALKTALIIIIFIYWFFIIKSVKNKNMKIGYLIFWLFFGVGMIVALIIPNFVEKLSRFAGFELPINMMFSGAILVIMYLVYDLSKQITKEQNNNTMLIQEISIMKKRIDEIEKRDK